MNDSKLSEDVEEIIIKIIEAETSNFSELISLAGLDPLRDLQGADLADTNLNDIDLRGANLREADLRRAILRRADLRDADLTGADIREADLQEADLRGAILENVLLDRAKLDRAKLDVTELSDRILYSQKTGSLNRVIIADTTLWGGEQAPGASMDMAKKVHLATQLQKLGVDAIEAGFPAASQGDFEAVTAISNKVRGVQVIALASASKKDIEKAWGAIKNAEHPRLHTFIATSDIYMKQKLKMGREKVIRDTVEAVRYAKSLTENVEFSAQDASRSDRDFLCRVFEAAVDAGATTVNIPDTVGYAMPDEFGELVAYIREHTPNIHKAVISVNCHNDLGLATANTLAGIKSGARQAEVSVNAIGEGAGNTSLEEVVMSLHARHSSLGFTTGINTREICPSSRLVSMITGIVVQPNKAIVGASAFAHTGGVRVDSVLENKMAYQFMEPETVGLGSDRLILAKHSGKHPFKQRSANLSYELSSDDLKRLFERFKELADKRKPILDEDIEVLIEEEILRVPDL